MGPLLLVVGPSGAGKDSLIAGARRAFAHDSTVHFARRVVTRPAGDEDNEVMSPADFAEAEAGGAFVLSWRAHGLAYGIRNNVQKLRKKEVTVIVNVSRQVVADSWMRLPPMRVILVTARPDTLTHRLVARGRESEADIRYRLERATLEFSGGQDVVTVMNDGTLEAGVAAFIDAIQAARKAAV